MIGELSNQKCKKKKGLLIISSSLSDKLRWVINSNTGMDFLFFSFLFDLNIFFFNYLLLVCCTGHNVIQDVYNLINRVGDSFLNWYSLGRPVLLVYLFMIIIIFYIKRKRKFGHISLCSWNSFREFPCTQREERRG